MLNQLFGFLFVVLVLVVGCDFLFRASGPRAHTTYRRFIGRVGGFCWRRFTAVLQWVWREYRQFIVGALTMLALLYYMGHLH